LIEPFFGNKINHTRLTFYELTDSIHSGENIISISDRLDLDRESSKAILDKVNNGAHAFLSANYFSGIFQDTLKINTIDVFFDGLTNPTSLSKQDTTDLKFLIPTYPKRGYYYRTENISYFFSTLDSMKVNAWVISTNAWGKPVTMRIPWGKGYFILNTTPLAFTNNYMLVSDNYDYVSKTLSFLPSAKTWWTAYYQMGRMEAQSPLRFILNQESLRWAYYTAVGGLLLFVLVQARRKQRIIPIIQPLTNTTMDFVKTIGNLYLQSADHKAIAEIKISFFLDKLREVYFPPFHADLSVEEIAKKSNQELQEVQKLFNLINDIKKQSSISALALLELTKGIEKFKL
jgi:hypothetical protein